MTDLIGEVRQAIVTATQEIFDSMIMMSVDSLDSTDEITENFTSNISSMLGLGGEIRGLLTLHFPEKVALEITNSFLGMEIEGLDEDVKDAVGEIANMVAGDIKVFFTGKNIKTELAIPTTVIGKAYRTSGLAGAERVMVPFNCGTGCFKVELKFLINT